MERGPVSQGRSRTHRAFVAVDAANLGFDQWGGAGGQPMVVAPAPAHCTAAAPATNESHVRRAGRRTARQIGHYWSLYLRQVAIWAKSLVTLVLGGGRSYENPNPIRFNFISNHSGMLLGALNLMEILQALGCRHKVCAP